MLDSLENAIQRGNEAQPLGFEQPGPFWIVRYEQVHIVGEAEHVTSCTSQREC